MKILDRYILQELTPIFLVGVLMFAGSIWIAGGPLLAAVNYLAKGIPFWVVAQVVGLYLPPMLVLTFPMAMLIAAILTFNRMSGESEAVALFASGVSFYRMLVPAAALAVVVTCLGLVINNSFVPAANRRITSLKRNIIKDVPQTAEPFALPALRGAGGKLQALVWVENGFDADTRELRQVTITEYSLQTGIPSALIHARRAQWSARNDWTLKDVTVQRAGLVMTYARLATRDINQTPEGAEFLQDSPDNFSFTELRERIRQQLLRANGRSSPEVRESQVALWDKIALPCASFVFAFVGAPLGLRPQRGAGRGLAIAFGIGIIFAYYALFKYMDVLGASGHANPVIAAFVPNVVGAVVAAILIARAST